MIIYSTELSVSLDAACAALDKIGAKYKVLSEVSLGFRKRPSRAAKEVLSRAGFIVHQEYHAAEPAQLSALQEKFS